MEATATKPHLVNTTPKPRMYPERIGNAIVELPEITLDVLEEMELWSENPRINSFLPSNEFPSQEKLEEQMRRSGGYDDLRKSIEKAGQMDPVYVWRGEDSGPYLVYEGNTRVTILRELTRKHASLPTAGKYHRAKAKVLPKALTRLELVVLLARIHVRGAGARGWDRYIQGKFIHQNVVGATAIMSVSEMADYMEKSVSWVQRLRDAYEFGKQYVQFCSNDPLAELTAAERFSTLEEISKAQEIGSKVRDYNNPETQSLRDEVFGMVRNEVFREYRDARFLNQLYQDPEKWAALKTGEKHIAARLVADLKSAESSVKAKIANLESAVERDLSRSEPTLTEDDAEILRNCMMRIQQKAHAGVDPFRIDLKNAALTLSQANKNNLKDITPDELKEFRDALEYFDLLVGKYGPKAA